MTTTDEANPPARIELPPLTPADADKRIDVARLDEEARKRIARVVASVPRLDGAAVNGFGLAVQTKANAFLDELLGGLRTGEAGTAGAMVAQVATGVAMLDLPGLKNEAEGRDLASRVPVVGKYFTAFRRFRAKHALILQHFAEIERKGRDEMARLAATDSRMDRLVNQNLDAMRDLEVEVAGGQAIAERERARYAAAREAALASRDLVKLAEVRDLGEQINAFEARVERLRMALTDAMLNVPQTRLTQSAGRIEYRDVADTLAFDLPKLKQAILRVAALKDVADARRGSAARRKLASDMAAVGIDALEKAYLGAKESEGGALAEITRMGEIADRIVGIIEKGGEIDARNRETRREAETRLVALRDRFVEGVARSSANAVAAVR